MEDHERRKFGLGDIMLTGLQEKAILAEMGWDGKMLGEQGESIPYSLEKEWFRKTLDDAMNAAIAKHFPSESEE